MTQIPEPNQAAPIGAFVRMHLPQVLGYCQANADEFANLQDQTYCLATFRQSYPVLTPRISDTKPTRYWAAKSSAPFFEAGYWVTSEWVAKHTAHFVTYLARLGIEPMGVNEDFISWAGDYVDGFGTTGSAPGGPRYRATAVGTVQNAMVRHLLGSLGYEAFTELDWTDVKTRGFDGKCAYCGALGITTLDHVIPINRNHLGEHRLGNLAPACGSCNGKKSQANFIEFLGSLYRGDFKHARERVAAIERHAEEHGYVPIEDIDGIAPLMEEARARIKEIAEEFRDRINGQLDQSRRRRGMR